MKNKQHLLIKNEELENVTPKTNYNNTYCIINISNFLFKGRANRATTGF